MIAEDNAEAEKERSEYEKKEAEIKANESREADQEQQQQTYEEILTDIRDQSVLQNYILSGQIFFMGLIFGALLFKILWDRFIR